MDIEWMIITGMKKIIHGRYERRGNTVVYERITGK